MHYNGFEITQPSVKNIQQKNIALMNIDFCINRITRSLILLACKIKIPVRQ